MTFNPNFSELQAYPFSKLRALNESVVGNKALSHIPLTLGEPKHAPPKFVIEALTDRDTLPGFLSSYPVSQGSEALRVSIADWLSTRFGTPVSPATEVLPVNGTREALFSFAQSMLSGRRGSRVIMPNPFYQIYEGAALLAGAQPLLVDNDPNADYQQDFANIDPATWRNVELVYICSPGNPTGQIMSVAAQQNLIELAHKYDFYIAADECYSELYYDDEAKPSSLLAASNAMGNPDYARCVVFHSLSKRSNLPGLRSGFVAGDATLLKTYLLYRTYHGCALSPHHQHASTLAWQDEQHVIENRALYQQKFAAVSPILTPHYDLRQPDGGFYHWLPVPMDEQLFSQQLLASQNVTVLPGSFLGREGRHGNPGKGHVRVAWVAPLEDCVEAANRLAVFAKEHF